jgi:uncharacterized protein with PIN domain
VTLFSFGRTIHCTCGQRVGAEPRVRPYDERLASRFMADAMLGKLSRWLRILGFDTAYQEHIADADLVRRALEERRLILTRDRALPEEWSVSEVVVIAADDPVAQLREIAPRLRLAERARIFTRCSRCNTCLQPAEPGEVRDRVPERVLRERERLQRCPGCGRVYWEGSHTDRMRSVLEEALGPLPGGS